MGSKIHLVSTLTVDDLELPSDYSESVISLQGVVSTIKGWRSDPHKLYHLVLRSITYVIDSYLSYSLQ